MALLMPDLGSDEPVASSARPDTRSVWSVLARAPATSCSRSAWRSS